MNKWLMFKNYMHNELGITKEDIREWIDDAVQQQAEKMVRNEFNNFDIQKIVKRMVTEDKFYGSESLKKEVRNEVANQLLEKLEISIKS